MNILDIIDKIKFSQSSFVLKRDLNKSCCVCFDDEYYHIHNEHTDTVLSLADIEPDFFTTGVIPNNLLILSCCGVHYICIGCIHRSINNYENHPINDVNSHFACPYPFAECVTSIGFKNVFNHNLIKKICNEQEWVNYNIHAERYAFPGFTIIKCPVYYYEHGHRVLCNTEILLENVEIRNTPIGNYIVACSQNPKCLKRFCFNCKQTVSYYQDVCYECKTTYENENPNVFNYFLNKNTNTELSTIIDIDTSPEWERTGEGGEGGVNYQETSYLYINNQITVEIAVKQITDMIHNIDLFFICPICKISLYKTERCNGLSHHNIERCYACGRIGFQTKGLGDHWNTSGVGGCYRFNHDIYVKTTIPNYMCNDNSCSNHELGDCTIPEHQAGIHELETLRKRSYVYHTIKSLLPSIRFSVYDALYADTQLREMLPYKQTLVMIADYKTHNKDYSEHVVYQGLNCIHPQETGHFTERNHFISATDYISLYTIPRQHNPQVTTITTNISYDPELATWRRLLETEILNPIIRRRRIVLSDSSDNEDNISIDSSSGLLIPNEAEYTPINTHPNDPLLAGNTIGEGIVRELTSDILQQLIDELNDDHDEVELNVENANDEHDELIVQNIEDDQHDQDE